MKIGFQNFFNAVKQNTVQNQAATGFASQIKFKQKPSVDYVTFTSHSEEAKKPNFNKKSILDLSIKELKGKRVLVRVDYNVPMKDGVIKDDMRIKETVNTVKFLQSQGAKIILMSHLGRPKGQVVPEMSLAPVVGRASDLIESPIEFVSEPVGSKELKDKVNNMENGDVLLLENIRFYPGEEKISKDPEFVKNLAELGDVYVNDAFGAAHRNHASTAEITKHIPINVSGLLMQKEIEMLGAKLETPEQPFVAIVGGSKISSKLPVLEKMLDKARKIVIVGAMPFTLVKAQNPECKIGKSLQEPDMYDDALKFLNKAKEKGVEVIMPEDAVASDDITGKSKVVTVNVNEIPDDMMGLDIGPKTVKKIADALSDAKTVLWNGPAGMFEVDEFNNGTKEIAQVLSDITSKEYKDGAITILGGGDTNSAIRKNGFTPFHYSFSSTGGGAGLELLEGKILPGVDNLNDKDE